MTPLEETVALDPDTLARRLDRVLSFPVTAFHSDGGLNLDTYRAHLAHQVAAGPAALFVCCGTGEFFSLDLEEYAACVAAAVSVAAGRVPVVAGVGYGTALARQFAAAAESAGADGLLVLPPYLVHPDQAGLARHYEAIAASTSLGVLIYQRDNAVLTPETVARLAESPGIVGFKDGYGDLDLMQRIVSTVRARGAELVFLNGMPTAEMTSAAYRGLGVTTYSSAVFCFAPEVALAYHDAFRSGDTARAHQVLDEFYRPYVELRMRGLGYAVSLVKAAVRLRGLDVGPVRSPLSEPAPEHLKEMEALLDKGLRLVGAA
jgi:5-dehydro-4-deoxyglucarate dehydratase